MIYCKCIKIKMSTTKPKRKVPRTSLEQDVSINLNESENLSVPPAMEVEDDEEEEGGIRIGDIYLPPSPPPACTFDSTGPRLIITHIENEFFKSYAGKQVRNI